MKIRTLILTAGLSAALGFTYSALTYRVLAAVNSRLNAPKRLQVLRACGRFGVIVRVLSNAQDSRYCLVGALGLPVPTLSSDSANQRDSKESDRQKARMPQ